MGLVGKGVKDVVTIIKDMTLFFVAYTLFAIVVGQWYSVIVTRNLNQWWYPTYLLIIVLIIKVIADVMTKDKKKK